VTRNICEGVIAEIATIKTAKTKQKQILKFFKTIETCPGEN
jgi:hypothetical protein